MPFVTELEMLQFELGGQVAALKRLYDKVEAMTPAEPPTLSDKHREMGYSVHRIEGTHDGVGNEYVMIKLGDQVIADGRDRISASAYSWINGYIAGHARWLER